MSDELEEAKRADTNRNRRVMGSHNRELEEIGRRVAAQVRAAKLDVADGKISRRQELNLLTKLGDVITGAIQ